MASDAHVHPENLARRDPRAEEKRRLYGIAAAASSTSPEELAFHRRLAEDAEKNGAAPLFLCAAVHPQALAFQAEAGPAEKARLKALFDFAAALDSAPSLSAIGETGFDLYDENGRASEAEQEKFFALHLETALRRGLPLVLHVRRAMHKIFPLTKELKRLPAVIFHSWPGSPDEGFSLLRRGINAFFSFGTTLLLNHKKAIRSCAAFPESRLLFETDAPWQPLRGKTFSSWEDLPAIIQAAAAIRKEAAGKTGWGGEESALTDRAKLERITDENFFKIFTAL